jgi:hypothetical protein
MGTISTSCIVLACIVFGALLGAFIRTFLSEDHLTADAKDVVKLATALMATLSALVLGLLISTAKSSFDTRRTQVRQVAANIILLDQLLAQYGPETMKARQIARRNIKVLIDQVWHRTESKLAEPAPFEASRESEELFHAMYALSPKNELQRTVQGRIVRVATALAQTRLSLFVESSNTISAPFLVILVFWLTIIFVIFSFLTRLNILVGIILFFCALSVSGAIFLILDFDRPFSGMMQISSAPLRNALAPFNP